MGVKKFCRAGIMGQYQSGRRRTRLGEGGLRVHDTTPKVFQTCDMQLGIAVVDRHGPIPQHTDTDLTQGLSHGLMQTGIATPAQGIPHRIIMITQDCKDA
jgi:hypothetical protein